MNIQKFLPKGIKLDTIKLRGWDYAVDSIIITAKRKKWDGKKFCTPIIYVNSAFEKMTGYKKAEVIGKDPRFLQGEKTDSKVVADIRKALKTNTVFRGETYNYKKDGTPFIISWHIEPIRNQKKQIVAYLAIQQDLTHIRKLQQKEKEIIKFKDNFVRLASHQLRTPLTSARWNMEILSGQNNNKEAKVILSSLENVSRRLSVILNALDVTSDDLVRTVKREQFTTKDIFSQLKKETKQLCLDRKINLFIDKGAYSLNLNRELLLSSLQSVLVNAIVYSKANRSVRLMHKKQGKKIIIYIKDEGIGLSKKDLESLWMPFVRGELAQKIWTDAIGSELYIAKRQIEALGGEIEINSKGRNKGVEAIIKLPS